MAQHAAESVAEANREAELRIAGYESTKEELSALRTAATSPDRTVTVVAGAAGSVLSVESRPAAVRLSPQVTIRIARV
ncbi:hypothetical protein ACIA8G_25505 [Lentzea sp. NPDC051213]|uniref:hypothetical protein n=1 Tax=Lentzea sp. NPDC051213 TaxID=3364126 RepID=UPI003795B3A9